MGNHKVGRSVGPLAEEAVRTRRPDETALDLLDRLCRPWRGSDAEWEAFDPAHPDRAHPEFGSYTDPHPNAALGVLMVEAFAPNGLADLVRYRYLVQSLRDVAIPYDEAQDLATLDVWWSEVYEPFKQRYGFW